MSAPTGACVVLVSCYAGRTFKPLQQTERSGLSAAQPAGNARLAVVGEAGARLIALGAAP
jgi:hypothetical protein